MAALRLPTEIYWQIGKFLPEWRDRLNLSRASKIFYTHFHDGCIQAAVDEGKPLLAWAYQFPSVSYGPVITAKKYLRAGGGFDWDPEWRTTDLIGIREVFRTVARGGALKAIECSSALNGPCCRSRYYAFEVDIKSEIGRVIAQIVRAQYHPSDNLTARLDWLRLILTEAQPCVLVKVEWQMLLCWICQHFDDESDAAFRYVELITTQNFFRTTFRLVVEEVERVFPPMDLRGRHSDFNADLNDVRGWGPAHSWHILYISKCPLTHLMLNMRDTNGNQTLRGRRERFARILLDKGLTYVESPTLCCFIIWNNRASGRGGKRSLGYAQDDLRNMLRLFCAARTNSVALSTWLGEQILPVACRDAYLPMIEALLELGADINARNSQGMTLLMSVESHAVFKQLLHHSDSDLAALDQYGHTNILVTMIKKGLKLIYPRAGNQVSSQAFAAKERPILNEIQFILDRAHRGITDDPGDNDPRSLPPIVLAVKGFHGNPWMPVVKLLLEAGADPNTKLRADKIAREEPEESFPPDPLLDLMGASSSGDMETTTLLHHAVSRPQMRAQLVRLLLEHGAEVGREDGWGRTVTQLKNAKKYEVLWAPRHTEQPKSEEG